MSLSEWIFLTWGCVFVCMWGSVNVYTFMRCMQKFLAFFVLQTKDWIYSWNFCTHFIRGVVGKSSKQDWEHFSISFYTNYFHSNLVFNKYIGWQFTTKNIKEIIVHSPHNRNSHISIEMEWSILSVVNHMIIQFTHK